MLNGSIWEIKMISNDEMMSRVNNMEGFTHGLTEYSQNIIYINESTPAIKRALYHELLHCWLYEHGHNQFEGKRFNNEDLCEISACSHDIIDELAKDFLAKIDIN